MLLLFSVLDIALDYLFMDPHILLAQLNTLLARTPSFDVYTPESAIHQAWLGQAHALVSRWNPTEASTFKLSASVKF